MKQQWILLIGGIVLIVASLGGGALYWMSTTATAPSLQRLAASLSNRISVVTDVPNVLERTPYGETFLDPHAAAIEISGESWRGVTEIHQRDDPYVHLVALTTPGSQLATTCAAPTSTIGVQFWGDENDGWAQVTVDGEYEWRGNTRNNKSYVEITDLPFAEHTVRIEALGDAGATGGGSHVTIAGISCQRLGPGSTVNQRIFLPLIFN